MDAFIAPLEPVPSRHSQPVSECIHGASENKSIAQECSTIK